MRLFLIVILMCIPLVAEGFGKAKKPKPQPHRCESTLWVPSKNDILKLREPLNVEDSRGEGRQRPGIRISLGGASRECDVPREGKTCTRVLRMEGSPKAGEAVVAKEGTRFKISRMGLNNKEFYISPEKSNTVAGISTYIRVACFTELAGGAVGERTPCTHNDINMMFVNLTEERCEQIRATGSQQENSKGQSTDSNSSTQTH